MLGQRESKKKKNKADVWLGGRVFKGLSSSPISYKFGRLCRVAKQERGAGGGGGGGAGGGTNKNTRSLNTQWSKNENKFPVSCARLAVFSLPKHQEKSSKPTLLRVTFQKGLR